MNKEEVQKLVDEFYSIAPTYRTKERLVALIEGATKGLMRYDFRKVPKKQRLKHLNARQLNIMQDLKDKKIDSITRRDYAFTFQVRFITAYRDLSELVKSGLLVRTGVRRASKYSLNSTNL